MLRSDTVIDATLIVATCSTKNYCSVRDPELNQTTNGIQYHVGVSAYIGADVEAGLVYTLVATPANANDFTKLQALMHGQQTEVFASSGNRGV